MAGKEFKNVASAQQPVYNQIIGAAQETQVVRAVIKDEEKQETQVVQAANKEKEKQETQVAREVIKKEEPQEPRRAAILSTDEPDKQEEQKKQEALEALKTQGKKGMKAGRINMAFTPSNMDFIRVMAAIQGMSMTQYVNAIIAQERERNGAAYEAAKQITKNL